MRKGQKHVKAVVGPSAWPPAEERHRQVITSNPMNPTADLEKSDLQPRSHALVGSNRAAQVQATAKLCVAVIRLHGRPHADIADVAFNP